jgi:hypothetical protein
LTAFPPLVRLPVGVVIERRKATSPWVEFLWRPSAVLDGVPDAQPWTQLVAAGDATAFYAGAAEIELYRSEADNYRLNLVSGAASVWVAMDATGVEPPYRIATVTADPAEGEALTESGQGLVEAVPMPDTIRHAVAAFVAEHHVEHPFEKRQRDRADPEALAGRPPRDVNDDER